MVGYDGQVSLPASFPEGIFQARLNGRDCNINRETPQYFLYCQSALAADANRFYDFGFQMVPGASAGGFQTAGPYRQRNFWMNGRTETLGQRHVNGGDVFDVSAVGSFLLSATDWGTLAAEQWINGRRTFANSSLGTLSFFAPAGRSTTTTGAATVPLVLSFDGSLSTDLDRASARFMNAHDVLLSRLAVVILDVRSGEVRAIAEPARSSSDEPLLSFEPILVGSVVKPIMAAAILSEHPALGNMQLTYSGDTVSAVAGLQLSKGFANEANGCTGQIDFNGFLRCSSNQYAAEFMVRSLQLDGLASHAGTGVVIPRAVLEKSAIAKGLAEVFDVDAFANRTAGRLALYWNPDSGGTAGAKSATTDRTLIPYESRPWILFPDSSGTRIDWVARYAFGGWENRWTLLGLAQAYARIATDHNVQATFLHRAPPPALTSSFASGRTAGDRRVRARAWCAQASRRQRYRVRHVRKTSGRHSSTDNNSEQDRHAQRERCGRQAQGTRDRDGPSRDKGRRRPADVRARRGHVFRVCSTTELRERRNGARRVAAHPPRLRRGTARGCPVAALEAAVGLRPATAANGRSRRAVTKGAQMRKKHGRIFLGAFALTAAAVGTLVLTHRLMAALGAGIVGLLLHWKLSGGQENDGELADSSYFFGFLLTLIFLAAGLFTLGSPAAGSTKGPDLLQFLTELGSGLVLTIVGLIVRQVRTLSAVGRATPDSADSLTAAQRSLAEAMQALVRSLAIRPEEVAARELQDTRAKAREAAESLERSTLRATQRVDESMMKLEQATTTVTSAVLACGEQSQRVVDDEHTANADRDRRGLDAARDTARRARGVAPENADDDGVDTAEDARAAASAARGVAHDAAGITGISHGGARVDQRRVPSRTRDAHVGRASLRRVGGEGDAGRRGVCRIPAERLTGLWNRVRSLETTLTSSIGGASEELETLAQRSAELSTAIVKLERTTGAAAGNIERGGAELGEALRRELTQMNEVLEEYTRLFEKNAAPRGSR